MCPISALLLVIISETSRGREGDRNILDMEGTWREHEAGNWGGDSSAILLRIMIRSKISSMCFNDEHIILALVTNRTKLQLRFHRIQFCFLPRSILQQLHRIASGKLNHAIPMPLHAFPRPFPIRSYPNFPPRKLVQVLTQGRNPFPTPFAHPTVHQRIFKVFHFLYICIGRGAREV